jgi:CDP-diacylglycerol--glycerol-3-phosphate 3-phosphatidyltransferase
MAEPSLTKRRLLGLDRSGNPPASTLSGQPLNPWTLPNLIGLVRLSLIPVFVALAFTSADGRSTLAAITYALVGGADYLDGMVARLSGQYSRLGALLDPLTDRLLVISGVVVTWNFDLLPQVALAILVVRELLVLAATRVGMKRGFELRINMLGRWAVWPTMLSIFLAMLISSPIVGALLWVGVGMTLAATVLYVRDGVKTLSSGSSLGR